MKKEVPGPTANLKGNPLLFVYGTLMKGLGEDWCKRVGAELIGHASIEAELYDVGDYPGAKLPDEKPGRYVRGELYRLYNPQLAIELLDEYEEFFPSQPRRSLFVRRLVPVILHDGKRTRAWVYLYNRAVDKAKLIPSGDYREVVSPRH